MHACVPRYAQLRQLRMRADAYVHVYIAELFDFSGSALRNLLSAREFCLRTLDRKAICGVGQGVRWTCMTCRPWVARAMYTC